MASSSPNQNAVKGAQPSRTPEIRRVTYWGMALNVALAVLKFVFGFWGQSQALMADAVHSLSDMFTDLAVVVGVHYWAAPADSDHPYGHGRIETLVSFAIGVVLAGVGVGLAWRAITTIHGSQEALIPGWPAFAAACISVVTKELLYRWSIRVGRRIKSSAVMANAWHHRSDALSSIPVAVAVLGTRIHPAWDFLDPIATVLVAFLIFQAAWSISWPALRELMDTGASRKEREVLLALARGVEGVRAVHALRTRRIGPGLQVDVHVQVDPDLTVYDGHALAGVVKERLLIEGPDVVDVLIHLEPFEP